MPLISLITVGPPNWVISNNVFSRIGKFFLFLFFHIFLGCCRGGDLKLYQKDIVACRPAQHEDSFMKNSLKNKVKPKEVGHPVFMIIAYPQWKGNKRQKKSLFFHYLAPEQRKQGLKSSGKKHFSIYRGFLNSVDICLKHFCIIQNYAI